MRTERSVLAPRKPAARSRVSNGTDLLPGIDGRSATARRFRDVLAEIISDLGGADQLSEGQRQLARRAATISLECERLEARAVAGKEIDLETYGQLTDRLGRAFGRLGLKRIPREVESLQGYIAERYGNEEDETPADPAALQPDTEALLPDVPRASARPSVGGGSASS